MGEVTRRAFCAPGAKRKPLVRRDAIAVAPATERAATSEQCRCGNVYGAGRGVHQELRGGVLVAFCEGCT